MARRGVCDTPLRAMSIHNRVHPRPIRAFTNLSKGSVPMSEASLLMTEGCFHLTGGSVVKFPGWEFYSGGSAGMTGASCRA